jgi:hypothetical protein
MKLPSLATLPTSPWLGETDPLLQQDLAARRFRSGQETRALETWKQSAYQFS